VIVDFSPFRLVGQHISFTRLPSVVIAYGQRFKQVSTSEK